MSAGDTIEFVGVGEDYISWRGGRTTTAAAAGEDGGGGSVVRLGLSYTHVGAAVKPGGCVWKCVWLFVLCGRMQACACGRVSVVRLGLSYISVGARAVRPGVRKN